ncbi:MAG: hypothetical protein ACRCVT_16740 [Leadbetterella sp.]
MQKNQILSTLTFGIMAVVLGNGIYKQFDFENHTFKKIGLSIVYIIAFLISIFAVINNLRKKQE